MIKYEKESYKETREVDLGFIDCEPYNMLEDYIRKCVGKGERFYISKIEYKVFDDKKYVKCKNDYYNSDEFKAVRIRAVAKEREALGLNV